MRPGWVGLQPSVSRVIWLEVELSRPMKALK